MAKELETIIKLQVKGGTANPSPPVGPILGAKGINIMDFCKKFNDQTKDRMGKTLPVVIYLYKDKSFDFIIKTPPAVTQLLELAKIKKGSSEPNINKVANLTWSEIKKIAENKMEDLNAFNIEAATSMVAGTARSMGITITKNN